MPKIYIVEESDYDSHTTHGVFSTEEVANQFSALVGGSTVEEYDVLDTLPTRTAWWSAQGTIRNGRLTLHITEHPCWNHEIDESTVVEKVQDRRVGPWPDGYVYIWAHGLTSQAAKDRVETLAEPYLDPKP